MLTIQKSPTLIILWLMICIASFVVSIPTSYILKIQDENFLREKREVFPTEATDTNDVNQLSRSFSITSNIKYRYATTVVSQSVSNPTGDAKEVLFTVTIPELAFISGFLIRSNDTVYEAEIKEKEEAKKTYKESVLDGETAGLVELRARDSNIFTVSVNVEPYINAIFELTYEQLLVRKSRQYEHIINVNPGQVVESITIEVNIKESSDIFFIRRPRLRTDKEIHPNNTKNMLKTYKAYGNRGEVTWSINAKQQIELSDSRGVRGQFVVAYDVARVSNQDQILLDQDGNYFVHFYAPNDLKPLRKHVLFCLDTSGSMNDSSKLPQLQKALIQIFGNIEKDDYFTLVLFNGSVERWTLNGNLIIPGTPENIAKAETFANTLVADGATNIMGALRTSIQITQLGQQGLAKNAKPLIIFLTDGLPNREISDTEEIVKTVTDLNVNKYPIYCLALGDDANLDFLKKLSISNWGGAKHIYVANDTHSQLTNFYEEIASTLLSNINFEYVAGQIAENTLTKPSFKNFFNGSELVVAGKLSNGVKTIKGNITGQSSNGFFSTRMAPPTIVDEILSLSSKSKGILEKIWAYLYINDLLRKELIGSDKNSTYKQTAMNLSMQYKFVTNLTSLLVRKPNENELSIVNPRMPSNAEMFTMEQSLFPPPPSSAPSILLATGSVPVIFIFFGFYFYLQTVLLSL